MALRGRQEHVSVVKCALRPSARAFSGFLCSAFFGVLHFFSFTGKSMPQEARV